MEQGERRKFLPKINLSEACTAILIPHYLFVNVIWEQPLKSCGGKKVRAKKGKKGGGKEKLECNSNKNEITHTEAHRHARSHSDTQRERGNAPHPSQVLTT